MSTTVIPASSAYVFGDPWTISNPENAYGVEADGEFAEVYGLVALGFGDVGSDIVPDDASISDARIVFRAALAAPGSCRVNAVDDTNPTYNSQDYSGGDVSFTDTDQTEHVVHYSGMTPSVLRTNLGLALFVVATGSHVLIDFARLEIDVEDPTPPPPSNPVFAGTIGELVASADQLDALDGQDEASRALRDSAAQLEALSERLTQ